MNRICLREFKDQSKMIRNQSTQRPFSQRQLRVGELVKQNLGDYLLEMKLKFHR